MGLWRNDVGLEEEIICDLVSPIGQGLHLLRANAELGILVLGPELIDRLREALLGCTNGVFLHPAVACPGELAAIRARARRGTYAKTEEDQPRQLHRNLLENCSILNAVISPEWLWLKCGAPGRTQTRKISKPASRLSLLRLIDQGQKLWLDESEAGAMRTQHA